MENVASKTSARIHINAKKLGFVMIELTFFSAVIAMSLLWKYAEMIPPVYYIVLAFATFRMARTLSFNEVAEPLRAPFTKVVADACGAGADVHPDGDGLRYVIGSLLSCPICTGTWSALVLFALWSFVPAFGKPLVFVLAIAGASEMLHYVACFFEWSGRESRVTSGKIAPDKKKRPE